MRTWDSDDFSGIVRASRGAEVLLEECRGAADRGSGTPIEAGTRFGLASMCKMFTAAATLDVVRRGELALDTAVSDVLPPHRRPSTLDYRVTVHHLLTHTSGIGDYAEEDPGQPNYLDDYGSLWRLRPSYGMERVDDFLPLYGHLAPVASPGEEWHYCSAGFLLLGAVLEEVTTTPFTEVVTERVLRPAGMDDSGYFRFDEARPRIATGYEPPLEPGRPWRSNIYSVPVLGGPDGGAFATAADIDRFLRAVADGSLLGADLTAQMLTPHAPVDDDRAMGLGVFVHADGSFGHSGGDPGVETQARHFPAHDLSAVVLCNVVGVCDDAFDDLLESLDA